MPPKASKATAKKAKATRPTARQPAKATSKNAPKTSKAQPKTQTGKTRTAKSAPAKSAPAKSAPAKSAPAKSAPAKSAPAKSAPAKSAPAKSRTAKSGPAKSRTKSSRRRPTARKIPPISIPRAVPVVDDDDALMAHGAGGGAGYGRCGGRMLGSKLEQVICDRLSDAGVAHSHSPRHFEVSIREKVAAYAPMVVLRGRGREGKSVVLEAADEPNTSILNKVVAFRAQYRQEYYIILVAPEDVLEDVPLSTYDEACAETDLNTLIARLAE